MQQIGPSPLEAFQIGSQLRGPSALGQFAMGLTQHILQQSQVRQEARIKGDEDIRTQKTLLPMKTAAAKELIQEKGKVQPFRPLSGEGASKFALAREGAKGAKAARDLIYPEGTVSSYNTSLVNAAKSPIGRYAGWPGKVNKGQAQDLWNKVYQAQWNKLRIESGAAIKDDEITDMAKRFTADFFSDPQAYANQLDTLETFHNVVRRTMDPTGAYEGLVNPSDFQQPQEAGLQLDESGLPVGGTIMEWLD